MLKFILEKNKNKIMNYNEIKKNIIEKFLVPYYRYTSVKMKSLIASDIEKRSWFPVKFNEETDTLTFDLGDNVIIDIKIEFKKTPSLRYNLTNFS